MKTDPNDSAHPFSTEQTLKGFQGTQCGQMGLTKREFFASGKLDAILSIPDNRTCPHHNPEKVEEWRSKIRAEDARFAVAYADALIAALNAEQKK